MLRSTINADPRVGFHAAEDRFNTGAVDEFRGTAVLRDRVTVDHEKSGLERVVQIGCIARAWPAVLPFKE